MGSLFLGGNKGSGIIGLNQNQLKDKNFAARFKKAGDAWEVAGHLLFFRKKSGLSQKKLTQKTSTKGGERVFVCHLIQENQLK
jgi:hypothetical protein